MAIEYQSAQARLASLPEIFTGPDLTIRFQWTSATASTYLRKWRDRGLVASLGGHSDVHANLLKNQHPNWEAAFLRVHPEAVMSGIEVLRRAGWTTQIERRPEVAIQYPSRPFRCEHFTITQRGKRWFALANQVSPGARAGGPAHIPMMPAPWALAEMLASKGWGACGLHPDDIDWDEVDEFAGGTGRDLLCTALSRFKLTPADWLPHHSGS